MQVLIASVRVAFALAFSLIFIDAAKAQQPVEVETDAGVVTMVVTVEAIDATRQVVTLVGPHNNWVVVKVGPEHLKLIKLKEKITISYADEVAVALRKVDEPKPGDTIEQEETSGMNMNAPTVAEQDWVEATPQGATDLTTIEITDTVAAINKQQRSITFAGTGGKTRTIKVDPSVQGFNQVQVGDMVVLEITRAVAVNVKPV
ncbi:MAG: hypothetical protein MUO37_07890 [Methyloceanibacter sp.]|jgi:hypothetical protein|nr:hypothetical protein [Methyloceanibacter sp.]